MAEAVAFSAGQKRSVGFLGLMRNRNYALLWWGQLVSELGNRLYWVAMALWVYSATRSASAVALAVSSTFVGTFFVSIWAGVLVDWFSRKRILVLADLARAVLVALIPSLMRVNIWFVYVDLALLSVATAFFRPAMFAVLPTAVGRRDLLSANSFFTAMDTGTEVVGPAIAGVIAFTYGYAPLLYLDAATFAVSALSLQAMAIPTVPRPAGGRIRLGSVTASVSEGLRFIRKDALQWGLFVLILPASLTGSGLNALQTPLAKGVIGITDAQFGTFNSVWGIGFIVASLFIGWFGIRLKKSQLILGGFFLGFISTAAMGRSNSFDSLLIAAFAVGFSNTLNYVGVTTVLMEYTPQRIIGRVMASRQVALGGIRILSPLIFGAFADRWGIRQAIFSMVVVGAVGTATVAILHPALRRFDSSGGESRLGILRAWGSVVNKTNLEFDRDQQVALNSVTIIIVLSAWSGLAYRVPIYAFGGLLAVLGLTVLGGLAKNRLSVPTSPAKHLFESVRRWTESRRARMEAEGDLVGHPKSGG